MSNPQQQLAHALSCIEQLEMKVAYQEDTIDQLNDIVTQQQGAVHKLQRHVDILIERVKGMQNSSSNINAGEELPPHY